MDNSLWQPGSLARLQVCNSKLERDMKLEVNLIWQPCFVVQIEKPQQSCQERVCYCVLSFLISLLQEEKFV